MVSAAEGAIVPAAVLYDLGIGDPSVRPDAAMGEQACREAGTGAVAEGCVGAGTGATVGKLFGMLGAMKSGVGTWSVRLAGGVTLGALVVTNAFGDVVDPATGTIVEVDHPKRGKYLTVGNPIKLSDSLTEVKRSPLLGEHTAEVLSELGYGAREIAALKANKVI